MGAWGSQFDILIKRFEENQHPRHPAGTAEGGRFAPKTLRMAGGYSNPDLKPDGTFKSRHAAAHFYLQQGLSDAEIISKMKEHFPGSKDNTYKAILFIQKQKMKGITYDKKKNKPTDAAYADKPTDAAYADKPTDAAYADKLQKATYSAELGLKANHTQKDVAAYISKKYGVTAEDGLAIAKEVNLKLKATGPQAMQAYAAHADEFISSNPADALLPSDLSPIVNELKASYPYIPDQTANDVAKAAVTKVYATEAKSNADALAAFGATTDQIKESLSEDYGSEYGEYLDASAVETIAAAAVKDGMPQKPKGANLQYEPNDVKSYAGQQVLTGNTTPEVIDAVQAQFPSLNPAMVKAAVYAVKNNIDSEPTLEGVIGQAKEWKQKGITLSKLLDALAAHFPTMPDYVVGAAWAITAAAKQAPKLAPADALTQTAQTYVTYGMSPEDTMTVLGKMYSMNSKTEHALAVAQATLGYAYVAHPTMKQMARAAGTLMEVYPDAAYEQTADNLRKLFPTEKSTNLQHAILTAKIKNAETVIDINGLPTETINVAEYGEEPLTIVIGKPKSRREAARFYLQQALPEALIVKKMMEHFPTLTASSASFMLKIERDKILGKKYLDKKAKLALGGPMAVPKEIEEQIAKFDALPEWTGSIDQAALRQWRNAQMTKFLSSYEKAELYNFIERWSAWPDKPAARMGEHFAGEMWGGKTMSSKQTWDAADFEGLKKGDPQRAAIMPKILNFEYAMTQAVMRKIYPDGVVRLFRGVGNTKSYLKSRAEAPKQNVYTDALSSWSRAKSVAKGFGGSSTGRLLGLDVPIRDILVSTWQAKMWGDDAEKEFILIGRGLEREADIWDTNNLDLSAVKSAPAGDWETYLSPSDGKLPPLIPNIDEDPRDKFWLVLMRRYPARYPVDFSQEDIPELGIRPVQPVAVPTWQAPLDVIAKRRIGTRAPKGRIWQ